MRGQLKLALFIFLSLAFLGGFAACDRREEAQEKPVAGAAPVAETKNAARSPDGSIKVGFLYNGAASTQGENKAQEEARAALGDMPGVDTIVRDGIPSGEIALAAMSEMIDAGCTLIIGTSYKLMGSLYEAARRHPEVQFLHYSGYRMRPNLSVFDGRAYEAAYLTGMVAGSMTASGIIGYVAAAPVPEVIRSLNAFALGAREVNPQAEVRVSFSDSWDNPEQEKRLAMALVDIGADVLAQYEESPAVQQAAEEREVYSVGYYTDMSDFAPKAQLTAVVFHWQTFYREVIKELRAGIFKSGIFWLGMNSGVVDIAPYGPAVPGGVREKVDQRRREIIGGDFKVFKGPVYDQDGIERIPAGKVADERELLGMVWLVEGVMGSAK